MHKHLKKRIWESENEIPGFFYVYAINTSKPVHEPQSLKSERKAKCVT